MHFRVLQLVNSLDRWVVVMTHFTDEETAYKEGKELYHVTHLGVSELVRSSLSPSPASRPTTHMRSPSFFSVR